MRVENLVCYVGYPFFLVPLVLILSLYACESSILVCKHEFLLELSRIDSNKEFGRYRSPGYAGEIHEGIAKYRVLHILNASCQVYITLALLQTCLRLLTIL